ncbi:MAG: hypothetical protein R3C11_03400 [Planctomycetaceae bacterium]
MNQSAGSQSQTPEGRPFLGVHLRCCNNYIRIYLNQQGNAYTGWCPRCATPVRVNVVKEGGTAGKFFTAD